MIGAAQSQVSGRSDDPVGMSPASFRRLVRSAAIYLIKTIAVTSVRPGRHRIEDPIYIGNESLRSPSSAT